MHFGITIEKRFKCIFHSLNTLALTFFCQLTVFMRSHTASAFRVVSGGLILLVELLIIYIIYRKVKFASLSLTMVSVRVRVFYAFLSRDEDNPRRVN